MAKTCLYIDAVDPIDYIDYFEDGCNLHGDDITGMDMYHPGEEVTVDFPDGGSIAFIYEPGHVPDLVHNYGSDHVTEPDSLSPYYEFPEPAEPTSPQSNLDNVINWLEGAWSWLNDHTLIGLAICAGLMFLLLVVVPLVRFARSDKKFDTCDQCGEGELCQIDATGHATCLPCAIDGATRASAA